MYLAQFHVIPIHHHHPRILASDVGMLHVL